MEEENHNGLIVETIKEGNGHAPQLGNKVTVHYNVCFEDGKELDSSRKRGKPFEFMLGKGQVIKGWDLAIPRIKVGEIAKVVCPPSLAYGS